jgi:hypothetical protein
MTLRERLFALPDQYINLDRRDERRELDRARRARGAPVTTRAPSLVSNRAQLGVFGRLLDLSLASGG